MSSERGSGTSGWVYGAGGKKGKECYPSVIGQSVSQSGRHARFSIGHIRNSLAKIVYSKVHITRSVRSQKILCGRQVLQWSQHAVVIRSRQFHPRVCSEKESRATSLHHEIARVNSTPSSFFIHHQTKKSFVTKVELSSAISAAASRAPSHFCRRWEGSGSNGRERSWTGHAAPAAAAPRTETARAAGCGGGHSGRTLSGRSGVGGAVSKIWHFFHTGSFKTCQKCCDVAFFS